MIAARRTTILRQLKSGDCLTRERIRAAAAILLAGYAIALAAIVITSPDGMLDFRGIPLGSDFFAFWSGGKLAAEQGARAVYDPLLNFEFQAQILDDRNILYLPFLHPPQFLFLAIPLAEFPYLVSWPLFSLATLAAFAAGATALSRYRAAPLALLASPAAFITVTHGQAGFLIGALFAGALVTLDRRPLIAGALFGLIAIKPQYGLLIPIALAAGGHWRAIAAAAVMVCIQIIVTTLAFGPEIWAAFLAKAEFARTIVLEAGAAKWQTNFTAFAALRLLGVGAPAAYALHAMLAILVAASLALLWRARTDQRLKYAGLLVACVLATPYAIEYDMILLAPAILLLWSIGAEEGFRPFEKSALAFAWAAPIFASQLAAATLVPAGFLSVAALYAAIEARRRAAAPVPAAAGAV